MTPPPMYTTNLSKAQGIVPETLELLEIWEEGTGPIELKERVRAIGALGKATQTRVDDVVGRAFSNRYLVDHGRPARWLKRLLSNGASTNLLRQLCLIYTARANPIFYDFLRDVYWMRQAAGAMEIDRRDAVDFLERSANAGKLEKRWSPYMMERAARNLLGTLADFGLIAANRPGRRQLTVASLFSETATFLAYELHFSGFDNEHVVKHSDWGLFGLARPDVLDQLSSLSGQGHLIFQNAGGVVHLEWIYSDMESMIDAISQ